MRNIHWDSRFGGWRPTSTYAGVWEKPVAYGGSVMPASILRWRPWRQVLREAVSLDRPPQPANWPAHLNVDGTERAREILAEFGVGADLF